MAFIGHIFRTIWTAIVGPSRSPSARWVPIEWAVRQRTLQQGPLNIGNTLQNKLNLIALATSNANGVSTWARWNPSLRYKLQVDVRRVPGYVAPIGTNLH